MGYERPVADLLMATMTTEPMTKATADVTMIMNSMTTTHLQTEFFLSNKVDADSRRLQSLLVISGNFSTSEVARSLSWSRGVLQW